MGYGANMDTVISIEDIGKIAPSEWKRLKDLLEEADVTLDALAVAVQYGDNIDEAPEEKEDAIFQAYTSLVDEFKRQTSIGLEVRHHDSSDSGSRYDDVDGAFFSLAWNDVYEYTGQMKALLDKGFKPEMKFWVTFG